MASLAAALSVLSWLNHAGVAARRGRRRQTSTCLRVWYFAVTRGSEHHANFVKRNYPQYDSTQEYNSSIPEQQPRRVRGGPGGRPVISTGVRTRVRTRVLQYRLVLQYVEEHVRGVHTYYVRTYVRTRVHVYVPWYSSTLCTEYHGIPWY